MERLTQREFRALHRFLRNCYSVCDFDDFVGRTLAGLARLLPTDLAAYCEMTLEPAMSDNTLAPSEFISPALLEVWPSVMHEHPVLIHSASMRDGRAYTISDFYSERKFHKTVLYGEFYRPSRIKDALCFALPSKQGTVTGIAVHRDRRSFTKRERLLCNLIRPHLAQARANAKKFTKIQQQLKLSQKTIECLPLGLAVLSPEGKFRILTSRAQHYLKTYLGKTTDGASCLPEDLKRWVRGQDRQFNGTDIPTPRGTFLLEANGKRLMVRLMSDAQQSVLLFEEQPIPSFLSKPRGSGLSGREKEVLGWVSQGKTNAEIGSILCISPRTVQKHLEHIFEKLGVESRTAAASLVLQKQSFLG
jgi:DNA-binding CsgD family transcriptional regulator